MRRSLVLSDETCRHPFLSNLPPHVRQVQMDTGPEPERWRLTLEDLRGFLMAYSACLLAVTAYIG